MSNDHDLNALVELSCHYDSMLWTVTTLWAGAVGGLLIFVFSQQNFDPWLALFGIVLTVCAMYFAYSFRIFRRQVNEKMPPAFKGLLVNPCRLTQWDVLSLMFLGIIVLWAKILMQKCCSWWPLWLIVAIVFGILIVAMWFCERWPKTAQAVCRKIKAAAAC